MRSIALRRLAVVAALITTVAAQPMCASRYAGVTGDGGNPVNAWFISIGGLSIDSEGASSWTVTLSEQVCG